MQIGSVKYPGHRFEVKGVNSKPALCLLAALLALSMVVPAASGVSPTYLTTGITQSSIKQTVIGTYDGVLVGYTNTYSSSFGAFVYLDLVNAAGQTTYWNLGSCSFAAHQTVQCFVTISPSVPKGTYTALVFATTETSVPVSASGSLKVTV